MRVEPRILLESGSHAIQVRVRQPTGKYKTVRRKIGTLEQARAALARFDATGHLPSATSGRKPKSPESPESPAPTTEPGERTQMDHVQTARNSLTSAKVQLQAQLRQIDAALAALTDEEDAAAEFRQPGALAGKVDPEVRERMNAGAAAGRPKRRSNTNRGRAYYEAVRAAILSVLRSADGGKTNGQIRDALTEIVGEEVDPKILSNLLARLRTQDAIRSEVPGRNRAKTIWRLVDENSQPAPDPELFAGPTPAS